MKNPGAGLQGALGAFSQKAALKLRGNKAEVFPFARFEEVFQALIRGKIEAAVIPVENTLAGSVHENYDHLLNYKVRITGETNVRIVHNLIAPPGVRFKDIRRVYSHPVALNQCLKFFSSHPKIERTTFYDTAGSVKMVMDEKSSDAAAIGSAAAAEMYGGHILKRSIEDDRRNYTRFVLLIAPKRTRLPRQSTNAWKTSLEFTTRNTPGALLRDLSAFALRYLNMTNIESLPMAEKPSSVLFAIEYI